MLDERTLRRDDFAQGATIRLADRQTWSFPTPEDMSDMTNDPRRAQEYRALTGLILESGSRLELLQGELALTIFLLGCNYELSPATCYQVLCFQPEDPLLAEAREALHALAMQHVRARRTVPEARPVVQVTRTPRMSFLRRVRASLSA